ncbi:uncharacterized protein LOC143037993 [Oratosquilla oratoria]|uniref:uncharacterized protein LOC143037993 n=1 Tax=Oratosquilla oratoria TaxID=337810 RepID=UPI003F7771D7
MDHGKDQPSKVPETHLEEAQRQVEEVVGIMKSNVNRMMDREDKLNTLSQRADDLAAGAAEFQTTSRKLKRKYWWQNTKMTMILACVVVIVIIVIIVATVGVPSGGGGDSTPTIKTTIKPDQIQDQANVNQEGQV